MSETIRDGNRFANYNDRGLTAHGPEVDGALAILMENDGEMSLDRYTGPGYIPQGRWDYSYFSDGAMDDDGDAANKGTGIVVSDGNTTGYYNFGDYWRDGFNGFNLVDIIDPDGIEGVITNRGAILTAEMVLPNFPQITFRQIVTYDFPNAFYTIDFEFINSTSDLVSVELAHGGDTYLYRSDRGQGYGILNDGRIITDERDDDGTVIGVGSRKMDPEVAPGNSTSTDVDGVSREVRMFMFSLDEALSGYGTGRYSDIDDDWDDDGELNGSDPGPGRNWIDPSMTDHGYGLEWEFSIAAGATRAVQMTESFVMGTPRELAEIFNAALAAAQPVGEVATDGNDEDGGGRAVVALESRQADEGIEVQRSTEGAGVNVTYAGDPTKELQYQGGAANETVSGGSFRDSIRSGGGNDNVFGGGGDDLLEAGDGNDVVDGGVGNDIINGGVGDDVIFGGDGADRLTGGAGADMFAFARSNASLSVETSDEILDFETADRIVLVSDAENVSFGSASVAASSPDALFALGLAQATAQASAGQAGIFVFTSAGVPGQSVVFYDTDGDGVLDGGIAITGSTPVAGSFGLLDAA